MKAETTEGKEKEIVNSGICQRVDSVLAVLRRWERGHKAEKGKGGEAGCGRGKQLGKGRVRGRRRRRLVLREEKEKEEE